MGIVSPGAALDPMVVLSPLVYNIYTLKHHEHLLLEVHEFPER